MSKGPIILGIGAALAVAGLLFRKGKPGEAAPEGEIPEEELPGDIPEEQLPEDIPQEGLPANTVMVSLKNPPAGATMWSLGLTDKNVTISIKPIDDKDRYAIDETIVFEIPDGVAFPLLITHMQLTRWNPGGTALLVIYEIQSFRPYKYDFGLAAYDPSQPDPSYRDLSIPGYGDFFFEPK